MATTATRTIKYVHQPQDAEAFRIVCSDSVLHRSAAGTVTPAEISWAVQHSQGNAVSMIDTASVLATYGLNILVTTDTATTGGVFSLSTEGVEWIRIDLRQGTDVIDSHTARVVDDGTRGAALRVRRWTEIPNGYPVFCGAEGEDYLDVVIYGANDNYYKCIKSHFRNNVLKPGSTTYTGYWELGTKFDLTATKVLLAERAKIDNLVVDDVETSAGSGGLIHISQGLLHVQGTQGSIDFGVGDDGYPVLKYYDANGNLLYDLGPAGIQFIGGTVSTSWSPVWLKKIAASTATQETVKSGSAYKSVTGATCYHKYFSSDEDDADSGKVYQAQGSTSGSLIPDGWYCIGQESGTFTGYPAPLAQGTIGDGMSGSSSSSSRYYNILYKYVAGRPSEEVVVYWTA